MKQSCSLVLASASPRRRSLLHQLGLVFDVDVADVDETRLAHELPEAYVTRLAEQKARCVAQRTRGSAVVLGADTTVVCDGEILNKPVDIADNERMLRRLRGREHLVLTAVALVLVPDERLYVELVSSRVGFRAFSDATLAGYLASGEGRDKAGGYGIQELGAALVSWVHGSYTNVVGLPAAETIVLLERSGALEVWP